MEATSPPSRPDVDAIVVGAGFGGIQMLYELRELGLSTRLLEEAPDVGGTWYWNRYPGARTDSEAWIYAFSFSEEVMQRWNWSERYPSQPEVQAYLSFVADRLDLRRHMAFDTRVESATYDERTTTWAVTTSSGETLTSTFLVLATGNLSRPLAPPFEGVESFRGEQYLTARWPVEPVDLSGKRVGVVGVGATGVQVVPVIAEKAAEVTVFQRTPNYVVEGGNRRLGDDEMQSIKDRYHEIWRTAKANMGGIDRELGGLGPLKAFGPAERDELLEAGWREGGIVFNTRFSDIRRDPEANEILCEWIRDKIRATVHDPATAELLCPKGYPYGAKRPPLGHRYYEAYNRDNVSLVDVRSDPIVGVTPDGLSTVTAEHRLDVIIFAVGFDASTGALLAIDVRGRGGQRLADRWAGGPRTYLGVCVDGFPNLFMISGPHQPFANIPVVIDGVARWIRGAISAVVEGGLGCLDPEPDAADEWGREIQTLFEADPVFRRGGEVTTFYLGNNVPGKPLAPYFYFGGVPSYFARLDAVAAGGLAGFRTRRGGRGSGAMIGAPVAGGARAAQVSGR